MEKWAHEELGIPLNEAASFFMRIRTPRVDVEKTAEVLKEAAEKEASRAWARQLRAGNITPQELAAGLTRPKGAVKRVVEKVFGGGRRAELARAAEDAIDPYANMGERTLASHLRANAMGDVPMNDMVRAIRQSGTHAVADQMAKGAAAEKTDEELKEEGRKRGVTGLAAEATREQGRRGARVGKSVGSVAGAVGGAALGRKFLGGGPAGTIAGLAAGMVAGGRAGEELGTEKDIRRNSPKFTPISKLGGLAEKTAAMRMQLALLKLADDGSMMAPAGEQDQGAMSPPPPQQELAPHNYLQAELMGQQAQEAQEQQFYRDQLKSQQQQTEQLNQQVQQMQQQLQQTQQQADQAQQQISQSTQQAVQAQDQATQQAQAAADARIAAQRMRAQILDLVSKDPSMFSLEQGQPGPGQGQPLDANGQPIPPEAQGPDAGNGAPAQEGPAAASPAPQTAPGATPPAGAPDMNAPAGPPPGPDPSGAQSTTQLSNVEGQTAKTSAARFFEMLAQGVTPRPFEGTLTGNGEGKTASMALPLIGAGLGAITGAAAPLLLAQQVEPLKQKVQELEAGQGGGFRQALALAAARTALAGGQLAQSHPVASSALGGLQGAWTGSMSLPSVVQRSQSIAGNAGKLMRRFAR